MARVMRELASGVMEQLARVRVWRVQKDSRAGRSVWRPIVRTWLPLRSRELSVELARMPAERDCVLWQGMGGFSVEKIREKEGLTQKKTCCETGNPFNIEIA